MNLDEYAKDGRALYSEFSAVVASILRAALATDESLRLQLVAHRAKEVSSLLRKLKDRNIETTTALAEEIKDLAGCRIVFYTNSDVERFAQSRIIHENFAVLEVKVHEPGMAIESANDLYQSNHFLVRLKADRAALPEYARFEGLRCEIQIQTILNHSWAQMAHDTVYKTPDLAGFGEKALKAVEDRLLRVMTNHLLLAGYEFDKIDADFRRLLAGKELFDQKALDLITASRNNNDRLEAIESFSTNVLPLYDDIGAEYRGIADVLVDAVKKSRVTSPEPRSTYFGALRPVTALEVVQAAAKVLTGYRYLKRDLTLDALCDLVATAADSQEVEEWLKVARTLAEHNMEAWDAVGPRVQTDLVSRLEGLDQNYAQAILPLVSAVLGEVLGGEVSGTTSDSRSVTFHHGAVVISDELLTTRHRATALLERLFMSAKTEGEQRLLFSAMSNANRAPYRTTYSNALAAENARAAAALLRVQTQHSPSIPYHLLETLESSALRYRKTYRALPQAFKDDGEIAPAAADAVAAAEEFHDKINADEEFVVFKTLVGFESVLPPTWENDEHFGWNEMEAYRSKKIEEYVAGVTPETEDAWFRRVSQYAATKSADLATFPAFGQFLARLGEVHPEVITRFLQNMDQNLEAFAPRMIDGLMKSGNVDGARLIEGWIDSGNHLFYIARYLAHANAFDSTMLARITLKAIAVDDPVALKAVVTAAERQYREGHPDVLVTSFLPALDYFQNHQDLRWVDQFVPWLNSPIVAALDEEPARRIVQALVEAPEVEHNVEYLYGGIAKRWPRVVLDGLGLRLEHAVQVKDPETSDRYQALPFSVYQLRGPLRKHPGEVLGAARSWYAARPEMFRFTGGHFVSAVFKDTNEDGENVQGLPMVIEALRPYALNGVEDDAAFALDILYDLEGADAALDLVKEIVALFDKDSDIHAAANSVAGSAGVLTGEFGTANMLEERKAKITAWLQDERQTVREFAQDFIRRADLSIASERRRARGRIAQRRLDYGEDPDPLDGRDA